MPNAIFTCPALFLMLAFIAFPYSTNEPAVNAAIKIVKLYVHMHRQKFLKMLKRDLHQGPSQFTSSYTRLHREMPVCTYTHPHTILTPANNVTSLGYPAAQKFSYPPTATACAKGSLRISIRFLPATNHCAMETLEPAVPPATEIPTALVSLCGFYPLFSLKSFSEIHTLTAFCLPYKT